MKNGIPVVGAKKVKTQKDKNKKRIKQLNKVMTRIEKQITRLHQIAQKLQAIKVTYEEKAA